MARGKYSKPSRGGGKHFSRDVQPVDRHGNPIGLWREPGDEPPSSDEDQNEKSSSEESSSEEDEEAGPSNQNPETNNMTREERRAATKAKKQAALAKRNQTAAKPGDLPPSDSDDGSENGDDDGGDNELPANPNHTAHSRAQLEKSLEANDNDEAEQPPRQSKKKDVSQLSRRERETIEVNQERDRYDKLHAEGKTEEARSDLARLAIVREKREAERQRKEAEKEEKAEQDRQRAEVREKKLREASANKGKKGGGKNKR